MGAGGIFVTLRASTSKFSADMSGAQAAVNRFRTSMVNVTRQLKKVGKQMSQVGKSMSANFTLPIVAAGGLAVKTFADFEQEMAKVQAVSGATGEEFKKLEKLAKDLGASTRFTASEVAALELNYSKLGFVPEQIAKITKPTLDLALATGEDLAQSAEVAGGTLRAFGLTADQMPRLVDLMAKSFSSSALTLDKFRDSMKSAAPVANAVGASLEDTTAIMSTLVDANIDASTAGTSLRNIFLELSAKGLTWNQAMEKIKGSTDKARTANELFGKRAVAAALVIADNTDKLDDLKEEYKNAGGAAKDMATIMDDTLQGSLLKVQSAIEGAAIELGKTLAPVIEKVGKFISSLANDFSNLSPETKNIIAVVAGLVAAAGPLLVVLGTLSGTILPLMVTGLVALTGPIGLVVLGITALAAGFAAMHLSAADVNRELSLNEKVTNRINGASEKFNDNLQREQKNLANVFDTLKDENTSKEVKRLLTDQINAEYGDYLPNLLTENSSLKDIRKAQDAINKSTTKRIALMLGQEEVVEVIKEFRKEEQKLQDILKKSGFSAQQIKILQEGASSLEALAEAASFGANKLIEVDGKLLSVQQVVQQLTNLENDQKKAVDGVTQAYEDLITTTTGLPETPPIVPKDLGEIGGVGGEKKKKKIDPTIPSGDIKTFSDNLEGAIINLRIAQDEARNLGTILGDKTGIEVLQAQRDALGEFINKALEAGESPIDLQPQIDQFNNLGMAIDNLNRKQERTIELGNLLSTEVSGAFTLLAENMSGALKVADDAMGRFVSGILATGTKLIAMMIENAIKNIAIRQAEAMSNSIAGATSSGAATGPASIFTTPAFIATAIGGVLTAFAAIPKFAHGGLAFGATLGIMGEGRGTTRANPEVIAPLDKLQGMMAEGAPMGGQVEFIIEGDLIRGLLQNTNIDSEFNSPTVESFN